ncbi:hypothetical protein BH10ACI4_BH10ACI4_33770 [soil metagenome]
MPPERRRKQAPDTHKIVPIDHQKGLTWHGPEYPVLTPGIYTGVAAKFQGPEWVRSFRRWSLRLEFALMDEAVPVSAFFNFGNVPEGPRVGRQSRYYKAWTLANGEHPTKGQKMTPAVFLEGQIFEVEVAHCSRDNEGKSKQSAEVYSRIVRIVSVTRP